MKLKENIEAIAHAVTGKVYAFNDHPLAQAEEYTKELYLTLIWSIALEQEEISENQILFLEALTQGFGETTDGYPDRARNLNPDKLTDFCETFNDNLFASYWMYDALTFTSLILKSIDNDMISNISYLGQLLGLSTIKMKFISLFAKERILGRSTKGFDNIDVHQLVEESEGKENIIYNKKLKSTELRDNSLYLNCTIFNDLSEISLDKCSFIHCNFTTNATEITNSEQNRITIINSSCLSFHFCDFKTFMRIESSDYFKIINSKIIAIFFISSDNIEMCYNHINAMKTHRCLYIDESNKLNIFSNLFQNSSEFGERRGNMIIDSKQVKVSDNTFDTCLLSGSSRTDGCGAGISLIRINDLLCENNNFISCKSYDDSPISISDIKPDIKLYDMRSMNTIKDCDSEYQPNRSEQVKISEWNSTIGAGLITEINND